MNGQKKSILFIEDQKDASEFHIEALIDAGYDVTVTAKEIDIFKLREKPFDLMILDIMIKTKDCDEDDDMFEGNLHFDGVNWDETGLEFFKRVRQEKYNEYGIPEDIPCIVATAVGDVDVIEQIYKLNPKEVIGKPYKVDKLLKEVESILGSKGDIEK